MQEFGCGVTSTDNVTFNKLVVNLSIHVQLLLKTFDI